MNNKFITINKISESKKDNLKNRTLIGIGLFFYFFILIILAFLADSSISNWSSSFLPKIEYRSIFAFLFIFLLSIALIFAVREISKLIFNEKKWPFFILLTIAFLFYLFPNVSYLIVKYFGNLIHGSSGTDNTIVTKNIWLFISSIIISIILTIIVVNIMLRVYKINSFKNVITLNSLALIVPFGFMSLAFIGLVKSWIVLLFIFVIVWTTDIFCYFCGILFGKHKMAPIISPNKTWEGLIGGVLLSLSFALLYIYFLSLDGQYKSFEVLVGIPMSFTLSWLYMTFISILMIAFAILGDLFFSYIKRAFTIKDYSNVLKSHGGILDRFDSIIFSSSIFTIGLFFITAISSSNLFTHLVY